jgi:hypothetical protein
MDRREYIYPQIQITHFVGAGTQYTTTMNTKEQVNAGDFFCLLHTCAFGVKLPRTLYIQVFTQVKSILFGP